MVRPKLKRLFKRLPRMLRLMKRSTTEEEETMELSRGHNKTTDRPHIVSSKA